jgi:hypothetical protein
MVDVMGGELPFASEKVRLQHPSGADIRPRRGILAFDRFGEQKGDLVGKKWSPVSASCHSITSLFRLSFISTSRGRRRSSFV